MYRVVCLVSFLLCVHAFEDFDITKSGYHFIYHDSYNLLLTVHDDNCYFSRVDHGEHQAEYYLKDHRYLIERYVFSHLAVNGHTDKVHKSSVENVRDDFRDLLADFTCIDKQIYTLDFSFQAVTDFAYHGHPW